YDNRDQRGGGRFDRGEHRGGEHRGGEHRGERRGDRAGYDNRRSQGSPLRGTPQGGGSEEPFVLPGESVAKYRGPAPSSPRFSASSAPVAEPELTERQPDVNESAPRGFKAQPSSAPPSTGGPRRSSGGLPRWLLAETPNAGEGAS